MMGNCWCKRRKDIIAAVLAWFVGTLTSAIKKQWQSVVRDKKKGSRQVRLLHQTELLPTALPIRSTLFLSLRPFCRGSKSMKNNSSFFFPPRTRTTFLSICIPSSWIWSYFPRRLFFQSRFCPSKVGCRPCPPPAQPPHCVGHIWR